ncbi:MAG TPA: glutamate--tRNA ligase, partial [Bacillota bacterium]|nr:glutamate--tRNA ligase [Bacillota bacterium]
NAALMRANKDMLLKVFDIDRGGEKPRKDLVYAEQIFDFIKYFFEERFEYEDDFPAEVSAEDRAIILASYGKNYDPADDNAVWFEKLRNLGVSLGYAAKPRDFKKNPDSYKGHVGHVSGLIRVAVTGRANSPDLWTVQQIMGPETVKRRIERAERRA